MQAKREQRTRELFETRSEAWYRAGLGATIEKHSARRTWTLVSALLLLIAAVLIAYSHRDSVLPGFDTPLRILTVVALVVLGWTLARTAGRDLAPALFRRLDPGTAGTVGFLLRLITIVVVIAIALRIAGLTGNVVAVGGAATAVIVGLAAQQTLGNIFAGIVLQSTRPLRVGQRVRLVGGGVAGRIEGTVSSLGLFYTTLIKGADHHNVPNSVLLQLVVVPLGEPDGVDVRVRLDAEVSPADVERRLSDAISVPIRYPPDVALEEVDRDEIVLRVSATPDHPGDGAKLAEQILDVTRIAEGATAEGASRS